MNVQFLDGEVRRLRLENERLQQEIADRDARIILLLEEIKSLQPKTFLGTLKVSKRI